VALAPEVTALSAFFDSFGGAGWVDVTNWQDSSQSVCTWFGITCDVATTDDEIRITG
jgi:hypothetical protein